MRGFENLVSYHNARECHVNYDLAWIPGRIKIRENEENERKCAKADAKLRKLDFLSKRERMSVLLTDVLNLDFS